MNELVNLGLTSHHQQGHTETEPWIKVLPQRLEKRGSKPATPVSVVLQLILTLLHSERPKLYTILAFLSAIGVKKPLCKSPRVNANTGYRNEKIKGFKQIKNMVPDKKMFV